MYLQNNPIAHLLCALEYQTGFKLMLHVRHSMFSKRSNIQKNLILFFVNIDKNMRNKRKNYSLRKIKGYIYKITHILVFDCPRVANMVPYKNII